ncbi:MAG TPA: hypothetical protein VH540_08150 [Ktedonobacterales bacterium]|jgi:hypothetical protein
MANTGPFSANTPALQPGERVSGPLPTLSAPSPAATTPGPQGASTSAQRQQRVGSILSVLGSIGTFAGFFFPTYLVLPLLIILASKSYVYVDSSFYLTDAKITGVQVFFLSVSFGGLFSNTDLTIVALQGTIFLAAINILGLTSERMRKFSFRTAILIFGAMVFLACLGLYLLFYLIVVAVPVLISLTLTAKGSDRVRSWLRMIWPLIGSGALIGNTVYFFSFMSRVLPQAVGNTAYRYDYFSSLGPGAWLSFAGLLTALLGGMLVFQAQKQASASTP